MKTSSAFDWWLLGICLARAFNGMVFVTYAASLPVLQSAWGMSAAAAGAIAGAFQFAYALSLIVFSNLADKHSPKRLFLISMSASAVCALSFAVFARGFLSGLIWHTLIALVLGGNYTTALMIMAQRYPPHKRGSAMGFFIASTSLGYALSLVLSGIAIPLGGYRLAFFITCSGPVVGALLAWVTLWHTSVSIPVRPPGHRFASKVLKNRYAVALIMSYTGHTWELLGMWAWTPAFLSACLMLGGSDTLLAAGIGSHVTAGFHLAGLLASFSMGMLSDRWGRARVMVLMAGTSTCCSLLFGWTIDWTFFWVLAFGLVYAFSALGDSPILSAALTETVEDGYIGAAFGLRSLLGFSAGAVSPYVFGVILDATNGAFHDGAFYSTWGWAFASLGLGGLGALAAAVFFSRRPSV